MTPASLAHRPAMSRKRLLSLLKLAIAAGLVAWVLSRVELTDWVDAKGDRHRGLLTYVREMDLMLFLGGCLLYFLPASFSSVRWWWLMRVNGLGITPGQALRYTWIGIFWNNVVPGLTGGDVVKAVYAVRASGKRLRPVMTVLVDRLIGLLALALLAAIVVLFRLDNRDFRLIAVALWSARVGSSAEMAHFVPPGQARKRARVAGGSSIIRCINGKVPYNHRQLRQGGRHEDNKSRQD